MPTPVSTFMYVRTDTLPPVPPKCLLSEDPHRLTPSLTQVTVLEKTSDSGNYSTSACQAIAIITASEWTDMCNKLADHTHQVQVTITYDSSASGTNKPLIGPPTFTLVPLLEGGLLGHIASAVHAAEERLETGVSSDVREDIKYTRNAIDGIQATLDSIKAKVDKL
jgi:hypothetical protein